MAGRPQQTSTGLQVRPANVATHSEWPSERVAVVVSRLVILAAMTAREADNRPGWTPGIDRDAPADRPRAPDEVGQAARAGSCLIRGIKAASVVGDRQPDPVRKDRHADRDPRCRRVTNGVLEGNLGDPPASSLNLRAQSPAGLFDLEVDLDEGLRLGQLGEILQGFDKPEGLEDDRPTVGHEPLQLEIDRPQVPGEHLDLAACLDLGDRPRCLSRMPPEGSSAARSR
jgi:hypothetical protein